MAFVNEFDPDKAQAYNELRQSSPNLSQEQLLSQAGISSAEAGFYRTSPIGFLIENPNPIITSKSEFQNPLNLNAPNLGQLPKGVSKSANINPEEEPVNEFARPLNLKPSNLEEPASGVNLGGITRTQSQGVQRQQAQFLAQQDWRFRISLAPGSTYLYNDPEARENTSHILNPLIATQGVIFPYVPQISVSYNASYEPTDVAHTNYRVYQYKNSNVGDINISGDFTAQDTHEANYLLAVIHFFKSVTKMFYGNDVNPIRGTPPPLCYLSGFGQYQFNYHPVAITSFSYSLPNDVDYIKSGAISNMGGQNIESQIEPPKEPSGSGSIGSLLSSFFRLKNAGLTPGAKSSRPEFQIASVSNPTYVPTKIQISLSCIPIISRFAMANSFSVKEYASGRLTVGAGKSNIGGIW